MFFIKEFAFRACSIQGDFSQERYISSHIQRARAGDKHTYTGWANQIAVLQQTTKKPT